MSMSMSFSLRSESSIPGPIVSRPTLSSLSRVPKNFPACNFHRHHIIYGDATSLCKRFCGLKLWILQRLNLQPGPAKIGTVNKFGGIKNKEKYRGADPSQSALTPKEASTLKLHDDFTGGAAQHSLQPKGTYLQDVQPSPDEGVAGLAKSISSPRQVPSCTFSVNGDGKSSLCIAVIGATGELAKRKIFPALFALYYSGFLPENAYIVGYSRKNLTDEDLRLMISSTLTCRIDHQQNCTEKMESFLRKTFYLYGGYDNKEGMSKLDARMELLEGKSEANRIFYLSVPQEALVDVTSTLAHYAQTQKGWNRVIIEKPFGFDAPSSNRLSQFLLSKFEENQIYRIDHLLGRNLIENLTVLRFSNLVFEPLWSRKYIRHVQVILSEDSVEAAGKYFEGYGIVRDIVHSHILQTIALFAMEPPVSLDGEDIRNEKVKVLRSIRSLEPNDVILGQYKATSGNNADLYLNDLTPTFFAAALFIDNSRWDGVPFMVRTGMGMIKHRVEIRIQFHNVAGNIYRECLGHNVDLATNELILRDLPDEAILLKVNNKMPGLGLHLDASELNLLYKDKYNAEVPDSYEHLLLDVIDGDNHLFMRSDELAAAWNILNPVLQEIDNNNIELEVYELGGRGPTGAYYLWAKHGVWWADD